MQAFAAVAEQLTGLHDVAAADVGGARRRSEVTRGHAQGALADVRFLVKGLNMLLVVVLAVVVALTASAIALDWAYFLRGVDVRQAPAPEGAEAATGGGAAGQGVVLHVHRGDGLQATILKAVVGSVVGFITLNLLKGTATPESVSRLGRHDGVERAYRTALAFVAAQRSVLCFGAAAIAAVATVVLGLWGYSTVAVVCGGVGGVCAWAGVQYGRESNHEVTVMAVQQVAEEIRRGEHVHIAVAGIVGAGKTSLVKALLGIDPRDTSELYRDLRVSAIHDPYQRPVEVKFDDSLVLHDLPGDLAVSPMAPQAPDEKYDVGIFVARGSVDNDQKGIYDRLKSNVKCVFVVLSHSDQYLSTLSHVGREKVLAQWRERLGVERIYPTAVIGYDPDLLEGTEPHIDGVDQLRSDIVAFLNDHGQGIVMLRHAESLERAAAEVVVKAVTRVVLGDDLRTVERRAAEQLHYLYTGSWAVTVYPPDIHPAVSLGARALSIVPYLGRLSNTVTAASTLTMQLMAINAALRRQMTQRFASAQDMQAFADNTAAAMDPAGFRQYCEQIWSLGPPVLEAGQEYVSELLTEMVAGPAFRAHQQRPIAHQPAPH